MPNATALAAFINDNFRSVWTLEILLFLKENESFSWRNDTLVERLRASDAVISNSLESLLAGGLILSGDEGSRYAPASKDLGRLVDETEKLYASKPDAVRRLIVSSTTSGLSAFADSFRFRRS